MTKACTHHLKGIALALTLAFGFLLPATVLGQEADTTATQKTAREQYQSGKLFYEKGQYAEALTAFQAAYDAKPHPVVLKSIAECKVLLDDIPGAIAALETFMADSQSNEPAKAAVASRLAELKDMVGVLDITSTPTGAEVVINGKPTGQVTPTEITANLGDHLVSLTVEGYDPVAKNANLAAGGGRTSVSVDFEKEGTRIPEEESLIDPFSEESPEDAPAVKKEKGGPHPAFWACAAVAGVGLIGGTVFGTLALNDQDDFDDNPTREKKDAGERNALIADISFGVAVAAAIAGTVVILTVDRDGKKREKKSAAGKSSAKIEVLPVAGGDTIGVNTTIHF